MGRITTAISVRFQWSGTHHYPDASGKHEYLKHQHRHLFTGVVQLQVQHWDRDLEFLAVLDYINEKITPRLVKLGDKSCEWAATEVATALARKFGDDREIIVSVFEDDENGAVVTWTP